MTSKIAKILSEEIKKYNTQKGENLRAKAAMHVYGYTVTCDITELTQKQIGDLDSGSLYLYNAFIVKEKENLSSLKKLLGYVYPNALDNKLMTIDIRNPSVKLHDIKYETLATRIENRINV